MGKDPRKERANQDPVAAVAAVVVVVAAESYRKHRKTFWKG